LIALIVASGPPARVQQAAWAWVVARAAHARVAVDARATLWCDSAIGRDGSAEALLVSALMSAVGNHVLASQVQTVPP